MPTTTDAPKKHITQLTTESRHFWNPLFEHMSIGNCLFSAKIGYLGKDFEDEGLFREPAVRFFRNELEKGDFYMELFNFDDSLYHSGKRILYRLPHNPNWESEKQRYRKVEHPKFEIYAVKMSDFQVVNETDIKALFPEMVKAPVIAEPTKVKSFTASESGDRKSVV